MSINDGSDFNGMVIVISLLIVIIPVVLLVLWPHLENEKAPASDSRSMMAVLRSLLSVVLSRTFMVLSLRSGVAFVVGFWLTWMMIDMLRWVDFPEFPQHFFWLHPWISGAIFGLARLVWDIFDVKRAPVETGPSTGHAR
jgi:hypothetical protein